MAQQTAVEWLFEKMAQTPMTNWYEVRIQALYMEKEQMLEIWMQFFEDSYHTKPEFIRLFDKYYNEKYEKNNQLD